MTATDKANPRSSISAGVYLYLLRNHSLADDGSGVFSHPRRHEIIDAPRSRRSFRHDQSADRSDQSIGSLLSPHTPVELKPRAASTHFHASWMKPLTSTPVSTSQGVQQPACLFCEIPISLSAVPIRLCSWFTLGGSSGVHYGISSPLFDPLRHGFLHRCPLGENKTFVCFYQTIPAL